MICFLWGTESRSPKKDVEHKDWRIWNVFKVLHIVFRARKENVGVFLLFWIYLRKDQQQESGYIVRGGREKIEREASARDKHLLEDLPGLSVGLTALNWADEASFPSSCRNLSFKPLPWCQCNSKYLHQCQSWLPWHWRLHVPWPSLFNIRTANKILLTGLKAKGSSSCMLKEDIYTPWKNASPHKLITSTVSFLNLPSF